MNRGQKRAFHKQLQAHLRSDGDNCSGCRRPLIHNEALTYGGLPNGSPAVVGSCCERRLSFVFAKGLFVTRHTGSLALKKQSNAGDESASALENVATLQKGIAQLDELADQTMRTGGVASSNASLNLADSHWKADDAAWFETNPSRSHRLRPTADDETKNSPLERLTAPPGHQLHTLVRQVAPGTRIRTMFARNLAVDIPDIEPLLHALFDRVADGGEAGSVIAPKEVAKLAMLYAAASPGKPS